MKLEYPKMVFKTRQETKIVNSFEEQKAVLKEGYGEYEIMVQGKKPSNVKNEKPPEAIKEKAEKKKAPAAKSVRAYGNRK